MTTLKTPPPDVLEYLQAVRATLADLPPEERDELMVDVETALLEAAEESERPLAARLGAAEDFAADLRAAAGLQARAPVAATSRLRLRDVLAGVAEHPRVVAARRVGRELAPIWWLGRAFVVFAALALLFGARTSIKHPWMPVIGGRTITFALLALFAGASLWLGLRRPRGRAPSAANVLLALGAIPLLVGLASMSSPYTRAAAQQIVLTEPAIADLNAGGVPLRNIYPYTRAGRPLHDVVLYDDLGRPLNIGSAQSADDNRRVLRTRGGTPVFNTFPILYFDPGTRRVADPDATAVPIAAPRLARSKPLRPRERP